MLSLDDIIKILSEVDEIELEDVSIETEELIMELKQGLAYIPAMAKPLMKEKVEKKKEKLKFERKIREYVGSVQEVQIGATRKEGGTRDYVVRIGGQTTLYPYEGGYKNRPVVSFDVFDIPQPQFPKVLREIWSEVWHDPVAWAEKALEYGADLITIHLVSTDPHVKDTSPREAAKTVEEILQQIKAPLIIGGSGNPEKDPKVFEKVAEVAEGELCLIASANFDLDYKKVAQVAIKYKHNVLSWTSLDINDQKSLNKLLFEEGLPRNRLVQDPTTAALGYGLEYTYSIIQRIKQNALKGDKELQNPISCGVTNAWGARESWMKAPEWGAREYRGPLWETVNALAVLFAGADLMMMLHPLAVKTVKMVITSIFEKVNPNGKVKYEDWIKI